MLVLGDKRVCDKWRYARSWRSADEKLMLLDAATMYARCEEGARVAARTRSAMTISQERASLCHQRLSKPRKGTRRSFSFSHAFSRRHRRGATRASLNLHIPCSAFRRFLWNADARLPLPKRPPPHTTASSFKAETSQERLHPVPEGLQEMRRRSSLSPLCKVRYIRRLC